MIKASPYPVTDTGGEQDGGWICTYMGRWVDPLDPKPGDICIEDICHSLAMACRFTGHVRQFYSTAQHSYLVSTDVPPDLALTGLLHDASEGYLNDLASPVKRQEDMAFYREVEHRIEGVIAEVFNLPWPFPPAIKESDLRLLRAEQRDLMPNDPTPADTYWNTIYPWGPEFAREMFITRFNSLTGNNIVLPSYKEERRITRSRYTF